MKKVFVKPAEGCLVRKGLGKPYLAKEGEEVTLDTYWMRRLRMKDVVLATAPAQPPKELEKLKFDLSEEDREAVKEALETPDAPKKGKGKKA